jgi:predicted MFS family arabinose efflux permease
MPARAILRRTGFAPLLGLYGASEVADWLVTIALSLVVFDATGSAAATTILFVSAKFLPAFVAPPATSRLDALPVRRTLPALLAVQAASFVGMAQVGGLVWALVALAAVNGGCALVARALVRASVATVLADPEDLRRGNGLMNVVFSAAFALGPALAGAVVAGFGARAAMLAAAGVLAAMAALAARAPLPVLPSDAEADAGAGWASKLLRAVRHVRAERVVARACAVQALLLVFFTMIPPIEVVYARHDLGASAAGLGVILATWGAGAVAGSAIYARAGQVGTVALALVATAAVGLSYVGMGLAGSLAVACGFAFLGGLGNGMQWIAFVTAVQERVPGELQARVMAIVEAVGAAVPGLGFALGGAVAAAASARVAYVVAGAAILALAATVATLAARAPSVRPAPAGA